MNLLISSALALLATLTALHFHNSFKSTSTASSEVPASVVSEYSAWKAKYRKLYATPAENNHRLRVFYFQKRQVENMNANYEVKAKASGQVLSGPMFALNKMADLDNIEFKVRYAGAKVLEPEFYEDYFDPSIQTKPTSDAPKSQETRRTLQDKKPFELRVQDQGACASCWAFATIACLEKMLYDKNNTQPALSQQELVDCEIRSNGCDGGFPEYALDYVFTKGLALSSVYPYVGTEMRCRRNSSRSVFTGGSRPPITNFTIEYAKRVVQDGIHAAVFVYSEGEFRFLSDSDDVYDARNTDDCKSKMDHALTLLDATDDTVTLLNSWGTEWGKQGVKKIRICAPNNLMGIKGRITHSYGNLTLTG